MQLGAGEINEIDSEIRITVDVLLTYEHIHIVIGESMIGDRIKYSHERIHIIRDYPNSMYFQAFDATILAGGYNSFHEVRNSGLPALFYPNMETGMDDQLARCSAAELEGWGIILKKRDAKSIQSSISELLQIEIKSKSISKNGAIELASKLLEKFLQGEIK